MTKELVIKRLKLLSENKGVQTLNYDEARILLAEIERLNNIIKTLEEYVIGEQISEYGDTLEEAKEYLEKLKRSDKK